MLQNMPELEQWIMRDLLMRNAFSAEVSVTTFFHIISKLIMYALFAMIGGLSMVARFYKKGGARRSKPGRPFASVREFNRNLHSRPRERSAGPFSFRFQAARAITLPS
jgi:NADH:ubiquinone oxidoreductase subunit D